MVCGADCRTRFGAKSSNLNRKGEQLVAVRLFLFKNAQSSELPEPCPIQVISSRSYQLDGDFAPAPACECMCSLTLQWPLVKPGAQNPAATSEMIPIAIAPALRRNPTDPDFATLLKKAAATRPEEVTECELELRGDSQHYRCRWL